MKGRYISGPAAVFVLLLFFLPWVTIACNGVRLGQFSGYQLAAGGEVDGDPLLWLIPLMAIIAVALLAVAVQNKQWHERAGWGQVAAAGVGLAVLLWKGIQLSSAEAPGFELVIEPALWGTLLGLLLVGVGAALEIARARQGRRKFVPGAFAGGPQMIPASRFPRVQNQPPAQIFKTMVDDKPIKQAHIPSTAPLEGEASEKTGSATDLGLDTLESTAKSYAGAVKTDLFDPKEGKLSPKTEVLKFEPEVLAWLVVSEGEHVGKRYRLRMTTTIGRDPDCDVRIEDTAISGKHAQVEVEDGRFMLYDRNSTNGVFIYQANNDRWQRTEETELKDGARIKLGRTVLHLMTLSNNQE